MTAKTRTSLRAPQLAGTWYPDSPERCTKQLELFEQTRQPSQRARLVAGVVPHAGWVFSGSIAYNVVGELARLGGDADTVVLFAGHLGPDAPASVMTHGSCWTPLGPLETDEALAAALVQQPTVRAEAPEDHSQDNSAEVEFPLIRHFFPEARIVIVGAPPRPETLALADAIVDAAEDLGRSIVAIGSTDLTHYGPNYMFTPRGVGRDAERWVVDVNDPLFVDALCQGHPSEVIEVALSHRNACCPGAAAAALRCGERLGQRGAESLRYATSAEIHPSNSFVGYAGVVI
jgi:AmmeMemoRadiSam system protein B